MAPATDPVHAGGLDLHHAFSRDYPLQVYRSFIPEISYSRSNCVGVLERDAEEEIPKLLIRQLRHSPSPPPEPQTPEPPSEPTTPTTPRSPIFGKNPFSRRSSGPKPAPIGGRLWEGSEPQVRILNKQNGLLRLTLAVVGGIQSNREEGSHVSHGSP